MKMEIRRRPVSFRRRRIRSAIVSVVGCALWLSCLNLPLQAQEVSSPEQKQAEKKAQSQNLQHLTKQAEKMISVKDATIEKQRWIILAGGLALLSFILFGYFLSQREKRRRSALEQELQGVQQNALRQQMNPHFIFNALSSIQYFILNGDKESSNDYITKFSRLMRSILDNSQSDMIPLVDELAMIRLYLELESMRFRGGFQYELVGPKDEGDLAVTLPAFLLQPYVENAIWHGLAPKEGRGHVRVRIETDDERIHCRIEDDGVGRQKAGEIKAQKYPNRRSLGTSIMEKRITLLNKLYRRRIQVQYKDLVGDAGEPAGTRVEISLNRESRS
jgi:LytS/YehU family sensor histidine kinase